MITFKRLSIAMTVAALMAGCSSGVKLDDKPVDGSQSSQGAGANGQGRAPSPRTQYYYFHSFLRNRDLG